jgi:hypothetical protein
MSKSSNPRIEAATLLRHLIKTLGDTASDFSAEGKTMDPNGVLSFALLAYAQANVILASEEKLQEAIAARDAEYKFVTTSIQASKQSEITTNTKGSGAVN